MALTVPPLRHLVDTGQAAQALPLLETALRHAPNDDALWTLHGAALGRLARTEESLRSFERALRLNPLNETALFNSAEALRFLGDHDAALQALQQGFANFPGSPGWLQRLWWAERQVADWQGREDAVARSMLESAGQCEAGQAVAWEPDPFAALLLGLPEAEQQRIAAVRVQGVLRQVAHVRRQGQPPLVQRPRRRLGWLSADFHEHATLQLLLEVLEQLDRQQFDCVFYSFGPPIEDAYRARLRACGSFVEASELGDLDLAQRIANDGIDMLVDLKGYTAFARPAPVQLQWLGYPGSLAAPWIDWIVADAQVLPGATPSAPPAGFTERVLYLPHSYQPNAALRWPDGPLPARADFGLPDDAVVLANFNSPYKLDRATWRRWMAVLQGAPQAVLWQLADNPRARYNLRRETLAAGVNPARVVFARKLPPKSHLARLALADLALDPEAMGGHTTTSDALRAGVPVLTVAGNSFGRRVAASLLHAAGLPQLVFADGAQWVQACVALALDAPKRQQLRQHLHEQRLAAALFDARRFAAALGEGLNRIWQQACQGESSWLIDLRAPARTPPASGWTSQVQALMAQQAFDEAVAACQAQLAQGQAAAPDAGNRARTNALSLMALARYRQGRHEDAALLFDAVLWRSSSANSAAQRAQLAHNLASTLESAGHHASAEMAYRQALAWVPGRMDTLSQLGCLLRNLGRTVEAVTLHEKALALAPHDPRQHYLFGGSQYQSGQVAAAMQTLSHALTLQPDMPEALSNLGICRLLRGEFAQGWEDFEARWKTPTMQASWAPFPAPAWQGEPLARRTLLVWAEQGLGDSIQFIRYLGLLRRMYPDCGLAFWGPRTLHRLFEGFAGQHRITLLAREEAPQPAHISGMDFHVPVMGLPRLLQTRLDTIPARVPAYLSLATAWKEAWRQRIGQLPALAGDAAASGQRPFNVGLVWSGQREGIMVEKRNMNPATLVPWLDVPGVRWFSLQVGAEQAAQVRGTRWEGRLVDWTADLRDFADTASLASALDLVITVDTSTAHAASAAGAPVWMLSRFDGCWRWLQERTDSPWYPSMTIWRQPAPLQWAPVISAVHEALTGLQAAMPKIPPH